MLESSKVRLELEINQIKKDFRREMTSREEDLDDLRTTCNKKVKNLELQLEQEHDERMTVVREKHELESKIMHLQDMLERSGDEELIMKLKRDLKRTKALLRDAQVFMEKNQNEGTSKIIVRQLKNQVEDAEMARASAMKAKQNSELELADVQIQLDDVMRSKHEVEERNLRLTREKADLQGCLNENEEELQEVMKKYKACVAAFSTDQITIQVNIQALNFEIKLLNVIFNYFSFITEGALEYGEDRFESNGDLTVWDAFKIGVKGANNMLLGSGLDIMLHAIEKAKTDGVTVPPFVDTLDMKVLRNLIKTAKTVHDQKLDRWGPRTAQHSVNPVPYDKRLAKKKKFQNVKTSPIKLNTEGVIGSGIEKDMYIQLCRSIDLRTPQQVKDLQCKYESKGKPYYIYGPRKVEVVNHEPYIGNVELLSI